MFIEHFNFYIQWYIEADLVNGVTAMSKDIFWEVYIDVVCVEFLLLDGLVLITKEWAEIDRHNLTMKELRV